MSSTNMSKHTPGPWKLEHLVGQIYEARDKDGFLVAAVTGKANAHLVAAAPTMKRLLMLAHDYVEGEFIDLELAEEIALLLAEIDNE
jgi:hypothetical protein